MDEPELVEATAVLTCGEYQQIYRFSMQLCPCSVETEKGLRREIQKKIRQQPLEKSKITLPSDIAGIPLQWKKTGNMDGAMLSILGIVVCFLLPYGQKLEEQKQQRKAKLDAASLLLHDLSNHFRKTKKRLSHVSGGTISVFGGRCNVYGGCQKDDGEL